MLDVDMAALYRWSAMLRSSYVPFVPTFPAHGATGSALDHWTDCVNAAIAALHADLDRFADAVSACASNYEDVS